MDVVTLQHLRIGPADPPGVSSDGRSETAIGDFDRDAQSRGGSDHRGEGSCRMEVAIQYPTLFYDPCGTD